MRASLAVAVLALLVPARAPAGVATTVLRGEDVFTFCDPGRNLCLVVQERGTVAGTAGDLAGGPWYEVYVDGTQRTGRGRLSASDVDIEPGGPGVVRVPLGTDGFAELVVTDIGWPTEPAGAWAGLQHWTLGTWCAVAAVEDTRLVRVDGHAAGRQLQGYGRVSGSATVHVTELPVGAEVGVGAGCVV